MKSRKSAAQILIAVEILALVVVVIFGVVQKGRTTAQEDKISYINTEHAGSEEEPQTQQQEDTAQEETQETVQPVTFSAEVTQKLSSMTLEEKVAQMFLITPEMLTNTNAVNVAGNATKNAINTYPVGGLVYSAVNFQGKEQTMRLMSNTQQYSNDRIGLPMFLAIEEVGGEGNSPIATKNRYEIQAPPSQIADAATAKAAAGSISGYLKESGITMNLVPFAGLAGGTDDGMTFGADASNASVLVTESVAGYREKGIQTAVGIFPGTVTEANGTKALDVWKESDALVFKAAVNAGCDCMVVGNVLYKDLTEDAATICSMSENVVKYLRSEMGFQGIIMTDSLSEEVVTLNYSSAEAAVKAINAGMNMLCCPQNFKEAYQGVIDAVNNGDIPMEKIDESVGRILTEKMAETT
uniref:glycoside hydrolase family 3 N-terminal domain-containing protein n=1 Tax=Agathobacter sp. TaxID=2021311 RepID=UPI004056A506